MKLKYKITLNKMDSISVPNHYFIHNKTPKKLYDVLNSKFIAPKLNLDLSNLISKTQIKSRPSSILNTIPSNPHSSFHGPNQWIDCGDTFLSTVSQGTDEWLKIKEGAVSGSTVAGCIGRSRYTSVEKEALYLAGLEKKVFSDSAKIVMQYGNDTEPEARQYYEKSTGHIVIERGLIIPKWNYFIRVSVDGDIKDQDGGLEIKCPMKMYNELENYARRLAEGMEFPKFFHSHIQDSHYCQTQLCMAVTGKNWFDYEVFCKEEDEVFKHRILWNQEEWENDLYPNILLFLKNSYFPLMVKLPVIPQYN